MTNGTKKNKTMNSTSKIRVYTNGIVNNGTGAYAYIVIESESAGEILGGQAHKPSILRSKFAQAGPATEEVRMKMRAVYEGVRHCPDNSSVDVYSDNFLLKSIFETTLPNMQDGDIAERYRNYVFSHGITVNYIITKHYNERDFPNNDHDEWTWWAYNLCENAIKSFNKTNNKKYADDDD